MGPSLQVLGDVCHKIRKDVNEEQGPKCGIPMEGATRKGSQASYELSAAGCSSLASATSSKCFMNLAAAELWQSSW